MTGALRLRAPLTMLRSRKLSETARTRTRTSAGPSACAGRSTAVIASKPSRGWSSYARISARLLHHRHVHRPRGLREHAPHHRLEERQRPRYPPGVERRTVVLRAELLGAREPGVRAERLAHVA